MTDLYTQGFPAVYILTNKKNGALYVGSTTDIRRRTNEHKDRHFSKSHSAYYHTLKLVYYEYHSDIDDARVRERRVKHWERDWKIQLIEKGNPEWKDLSPEVACWTR